MLYISLIIQQKTGTPKHFFKQLIFMNEFSFFDKIINLTPTLLYYFTNLLIVIRNKFSKKHVYSLSKEFSYKINTYLAAFLNVIYL